MRKTLHAVLISAATLSGSLAGAQSINVFVDGKPLLFQGTGAQRLNGRVMVPLRGIFEALGASVEWVPSTRTAIAQKGDIDLELTIGERIAKVNARDVLLDVPASVLNGSTMVPLRFIGEALKADVVWEGATQTVRITSLAEAPGSAPTATGVPEIASVTVKAPAWVRSGNPIEVTLTGSSGGTASFQIPGVVREVPMTEISAGKYVGTWSPDPLKETTLSEAVVLAQLSIGTQQKLIQAGRTVSVDTLAPKVKNTLPEAGGTVGPKPSVGVVMDEVGSGLDPTTIKLTVAGVDRTAEASVSSGFLTYVPAQPLPPGEVKIQLSVADRAGNTLVHNWSFTVADASSVVKRVFHDGARALEPGDVLKVTMEGEKGGSARFSIGSKVVDRPMIESTPGNYTGEYVIRKGDSFGPKDAITATLTTAAGKNYTVEAPEKLGVSTGPLTTPTFKSHADGDKVKGSIVLTGTANPGTTVQISVEYTTVLLGALRTGGKVWEGTAAVDDNGQFTTPSIDLDTLIAGSNTEYTVRVRSTTDDGRSSETAVLKLKKG